MRCSIRRFDPRALPMSLSPLSPERRAHAQHERVQASPQPGPSSRTGSASSPGDLRTTAEAAATDVLRAVYAKRAEGGEGATTATMMGPEVLVAFTESEWSERDREVSVSRRGG